MMEFLLYLTPIGQELISKIMMKNYRVVENSAYCRNKELFGGIDSSRFVICTNNIKNTISPVKHYVNETVYHEAVHVVQACRGMNPIGIPLSQMPLPSTKMGDINRSISLTKKKWMRQMEHEAFWLEDKPKQVIYYLKKFCF